MAQWDFYENNPWEGVNTKSRDFYVPTLRNFYTRRSTYSRFVTSQINLSGDMRTEQAHITSIIPPHANINEIQKRQLWMLSSYTDSKERRVTYKSYGGKMSFYELDDLITYWEANGREAGITNIINSGLGHMMTRTMNLLARNAMLSTSFALYGTDTGTKFNKIKSTDRLSTELIEDIQLGMVEREVPYTQNIDDGLGQIFCLTSPGALRDLRNEVKDNKTGWHDVHMYTPNLSGQIVRGEVGSYHGVRFIQTNDACLYNAGDLLVQTTVTAAINQGDGAPDSTSSAVDGVYFVGQQGVNAVHYITVASSSGFAEDDIITIHKLRTNAFGVTDGLDWRDGAAETRRVVSVVDGTKLALDEPIMEDFTTDLGGGVYAYVTKARHVHTNTFVGGQDGVILSVLQAPTVVVPPPVDDLMAMYRVSWKGRFAYTLFEPKVLEVAFTAGSNRYKGARY